MSKVTKDPIYKTNSGISCPISLNNEQYSTGEGSRDVKLLFSFFRHGARGPSKVNFVTKAMKTFKDNEITQ